MLLKNFLYKYFFNFIPDSIWIRFQFRRKMGCWPNLKNPKTFNEKLQWLKLYDHNPLYTKLVDKYEAKKIVGEQIGDEYIIPTLGVWDKFDDIDFDKLPDQFVLKCTHDSGGLVICKDKSKFDISAAKKKICNCLKFNYYWAIREWPYKNVKPRIIAEKYLEENEILTSENSTKEKTDAIRDFKFFCFGGVPKIMYVSRDKAEQPTTDFFDMSFNHLDMRMRDPNSSVLPPCPKNFELMQKLAQRLSTNFPHVRVDFYEIGDQVYFGEMTFYHNSGLSHVYPSKWEQELGEWIKLPDAKV